MIVYMTQGQKTVLSRITVEGLPLHYLSVGRGYFARRRALRCLRRMARCPPLYLRSYLLSLAKQADITSYPVLPLRLALLGSLLDILCPGGLQNAAAVLRCGPGGRGDGPGGADGAGPAGAVCAAGHGGPCGAGGGVAVPLGDRRRRRGPAAALTVVCGDVREDTEGPAIYLTEDCGARQTPVWTSPRAAALAVPVTEPLAAVLTAAGKWQISDIHITDLLDIRTESHYNAT